MCRPQLVGMASSAIFFDIEQMRNPCLEQKGVDFIPNDFKLGLDDICKMIVITGSNMGGKSTFLRTSCLIAIIA